MVDFKFYFLTEISVEIVSNYRYLEIAEPKISALLFPEFKKK